MELANERLPTRRDGRESMRPQARKSRPKELLEEPRPVRRRRKHLQQVGDDSLFRARPAQLKLHRAEGRQRPEQRLELAQELELRRQVVEPSRHRAYLTSAAAQNLQEVDARVIHAIRK